MYRDNSPGESERPVVSVCLVCTRCSLKSKPAKRRLIHTHVLATMSGRNVKLTRGKILQTLLSRFRPDVLGFSNDMPPDLYLIQSCDPKSEEFLKSFRSLLSSERESKHILALPENDARLFIEIVDKVCSSRTSFSARSLFISLIAKALGKARLDIELQKIAFSVLRRLSGRTGYLPKSYLLPDKFDLSGMPHASGGFADIRRRVFKGKDVAVKSLRVAELDDKIRIRKVGNQAGVSHLGSLTPCAAVL